MAILQMHNKEEGLQFLNYGDVIHLESLVRLIEDYRNDPMGSGSSESHTYTRLQQFRLIAGLEKNPCSRVFLWNESYLPVAVAVCFEGFSTFMVRPTLNIHDFYVDKNHRGRGIGTHFLKSIIRYCQEKDYGKITLEVRHDNTLAQKLYKKTGFAECEPRMYFWSRSIHSD
jgi:ribosomal protein S18 acetylase RimI-like enzyme